MDSNKSKAPLMYGIVGPDGAAHIDENCVASSPDQLFAELNGLNDSPDAGYKIVALGQVYLDVAAPQVVADEADLECQVPPFGWRCTRGAGHPGPCAAVECPEDIAAVKRGMARLAAAPVHAQEPVAYRVTYKDFRHFSGATATGQDKLQFKPIAADDGYFKGCNSLVITPLYAAPVQPVAVPDGWKLVPIRATGVQREAARAKLGFAAMYEAAVIAAPAAQSDAIRSVEVDDQGPLGVVTTTTYRLGNAQDAKDAERWREALQYVGADRSPALGCNYFVLRGIHAIPGTDLMRGGVAGHFTEAIDAAIAAKAAS